MIIFIDISNQIIEDENAFCFYNTVNGKFIEVLAGETVYETAEDFINSTKESLIYAKENCKNSDTEISNLENIYNRCIKQIPKSFYENETTI